MTHFGKSKNSYFYITSYKILSKNWNTKITQENFKFIYKIDMKVAKIVPRGTK